MTTPAPTTPPSKPRPPIEQTQFIRNTICDTLKWGGKLRVFANGCYQDITEISLDSCGGVILKLDRVKDLNIIAEEELAACAALFASPRSNQPN